MSAPNLPAIAALTFNADRDAERSLTAAARGRRAGQPIGPHGEIFRAALRTQARRTPTHRKEQQS